ncbi:MULTISPECIES: YdaU family protein [unclassified Polaromonas]|jgi:uncharacterized protein YdaU (DUF1376 family)|uniref:YdaU family protein n=1 Tax=unclassified Polaromonas TaxID=2638319 RepID=UPI000BC75888|nr:MULTISPECIES: YdaU family protein [unclassified Polaromonas]OYY34767.1 MAG: hypothetical protein B7Y60_15110 [Polaromonas sp. 35-63-35]OYZ19346.1 MAG: hypothetical protein B7Y28_12480 [Polaromonas sp. 16-63-31]OYZ77527.1 MAG: hypothetical protein B7Y09_16265 [Polaromonas sp. 24-63-21]OZA48489.1 MAG: hypothetical protein B7X88_18250 [Polaromonas sp. 17-63-33]OZA87238.1 MAG: hypothetical protein B7X65_13725 [Polaromonas sp. 39-63-25]
MNLYLRHIGDFNNATRHLTRVERSVYSDAIELYYDTEQPLQCVDMAALERRLLCRSDDEKGALKAILAEFFVLTDAGYTHARCDAEIAKYRANTSAKARAGIASAAARKQNSTADQHKSTPVEHTSTNRKPLTVNHKPMERERATRIPADFEPKPEPEAESGIDRQKELANFRDYWTSKARDNTKLDWQATWRQWARKADRPGVSRFAKPDPSATVPSRPGPDPELLKAEADSKNRAPMPDAVREFKSRMKQGATT